MVWNWTDYNVSHEFGFDRDINSIQVSLTYLVSAISGSPGRVRVLLDDATVLGRLGGERFDLIVTDPPYRDDVAYAEMSDFYYVWLKRALSDVRESFGVVRLVPRFHREEKEEGAFFDEFGNEIETQWKAFALREVSESEGRARYFRVEPSGFDHFKSLLSESFKSMASKLNDDGLLITYYAHTSPEAWEALLEAGWRSARLRVTAAHAVTTEPLLKARMMPLLRRSAKG